MDSFLLHPKLVHLPIALAVLMPLVSGSVLLAMSRGWFQRRVWSLVVGLQVILFASGVLAMRTGETDEERVERVVPESAIESHEEAAEPFVWASGLLVLLGTLPLVLRGARASQLAAIATVAGTLVVLGLGWRVGQSGGELVYRHGAAAAFVNQAAPPGSGARVGTVDDDDR